jgi:hypothetical protein
MSPTICITAIRRTLVLRVRKIADTSANKNDAAMRAMSARAVRP